MLSPQDSYRCIKDANEKYLQFLCECQCEYSCVVGVKVAQRYCKLTKIEAYLRTQTKFFFYKNL